MAGDVQALLRAVAQMALVVDWHAALGAAQAERFEQFDHLDGALAR